MFVVLSEVTIKVTAGVTVMDTRPWWDGRMLCDAQQFKAAAGQMGRPLIRGLELLFATRCRVLAEDNHFINMLNPVGVHANEHDTHTHALIGISTLIRMFY